MKSTVSVALGLIVAAVLAQAQPTKVFYVANSATNNVAALVQDANSKALTLSALVPAGFQPSSIALIPSALEAVVTNRGDDNLYCYKIEPSSGALTRTGSAVATETQPAFVAVDPLQQHVFVLNSGSNSISGFNILPNCSFTPISGSPFATGSSPSSMLFDSAGRAFVSNAWSNNIWGYNQDPTTGALTAGAGSPFATGGNPTRLAIDGLTGDILVANSADHDVQIFQNSNGALQPAASFRTGLNPSAITIANGLILVANKDSNTISVFRKLLAPRTPNPLPGSPFQAGPVDLTFDPDNQSVTVVDFNTAAITEYVFDPVANTFLAVAGSPVLTGGANPVKIAGVTLGIEPPVLTEAFGLDYVRRGTSVNTTLTFTIANPNPSNYLTDIGFSDAMPDEITVLGVSTNNCSGVLSFTADNTFSMAGVSLAPNGSCSVVLNIQVDGSYEGPITNTTSPVSSNAPGLGAAATATVGVGTLPAPVIGTTSLPTGTLNVLYTAPISVTGGVLPYSFTASGLPPGLSIGLATGIISGTPALAGVSTVTIIVTDSSNPTHQTATKSFPLTILSSSASIILGSIGPLSPGQQASISVALTSPAGPGGAFITLTSSDPSIAVFQPGNGASTTFFIQPGALVSTRTSIPVLGVSFGAATITASSPGLTPASTPVTVGATLVFSPASIAMIGFPTQKTIALTLSAPAPATGLLVNLVSGSPGTVTVPATAFFAANASFVTVPVSAVAAGSASITASTLAPNVTPATANINVVAGLSTPVTTLPDGVYNQPYSQTLLAVGGTPPYIWTLTGGVLPAGLKLNSSGQITGTPTAVVIKTPLQFTVTDSSAPPRTAVASVTLTILQ